MRWRATLSLSPIRAGTSNNNQEQERLNTGYLSDKSPKTRKHRIYLYALKGEPINLAAAPRLSCKYSLAHAPQYMCTN